MSKKVQKRAGVPPPPPTASEDSLQDLGDFFNEAANVQGKFSEKASGGDFGNNEHSQWDGAAENAHAEFEYEDEEDKPDPFSHVESSSGDDPTFQPDKKDKEKDFEDDSDGSLSDVPSDTTVLQSVPRRS